MVELEYEAYAEMAGSVLDEIRAEAEQRFGVAVCRGPSVRRGADRRGGGGDRDRRAHRAEAYEANRFVIEAIKERLPIWKRERFADGSEWKRPGA